MERKVSKAEIVYQLKVTLMDIEPPIWRRIVVPADTTLSNLHRILQTAVGWTNSHLHDFQKGKKNYGPPNLHDEMGLVDYRRLKLKSFFSEVGGTFIYNYDYGDGWTHLILLEGIMLADPDVHYPVCTDGSRRAPPEDCGGPPGYEENLEIIANKKHPEYRSTIQWLPAGYDPEAFDRETINILLKRRGFGLPD